MTELEQQLTGENKVLRDLLKTALPIIQMVRDETGFGEGDMLDALASQIDGALMGAPDDLLENIL